MAIGTNPYEKSAELTDNQLRGLHNRGWGLEAESIASEYLLKNGYVIRERNWRCGRNEIDIIAELGRSIIFVEVKARSGLYDDPVEAVGCQKRARMIRGADVYLSAIPYKYQYRFDIISITGTRENFKLKHYPDAFLPPVNGRVMKKKTI